MWFSRKPLDSTCDTPPSESTWDLAAHSSQLTAPSSSHVAPSWGPSPGPDVPKPQAQLCCGSPLAPSYRPPRDILSSEYSNILFLSFYDIPLSGRPRIHVLHRRPEVLSQAVALVQSKAVLWRC